MSEIKFDYDYFLKTKDGNMSLQTMEQRIEDAAALCKNGTIIVFPDGKRVSNASEIRRAIEEYKKNTPKTSNIFHKSPKGKVKKLCIIIGFVTVGVFVSWYCISWIRYRQLENEWAESETTTETSHYKNVRTAINDGSIKYGMTYEEITEICGYPSGGTIKDNGYVTSAYYNGGYFVLRFDKGRYNGRYTEY